MAELGCRPSLPAPKFSLWFLIASASKETRIHDQRAREFQSLFLEILRQSFLNAWAWLWWEQEEQGVRAATAFLSQARHRVDALVFRKMTWPVLYTSLLLLTASVFLSASGHTHVTFYTNIFPRWVTLMFANVISDCLDTPLAATWDTMARQHDRLPALNSEGVVLGLIAHRPWG